jgi:hypothetical protein
MFEARNGLFKERSEGFKKFEPFYPFSVLEVSDESITLHLKQALDLIDVKVLDHFVIAGAEMVSMAERGVV